MCRERFRARCGRAEKRLGVRQKSRAVDSFRFVTFLMSGDRSHPGFFRGTGQFIKSAIAWLRQLLTLLQKFSYEIVVCCALGLPLFFKLVWLASARQKQKRTVRCWGLKFHLVVLSHRNEPWVFTP